MEDEAWIRNWREERTKRDQLLQREIYLKEELEKLGANIGKEHTSSEYASSNTEASSGREKVLKKDLDAISRKLWEHKQNCAKLVRELRDEGPMVAAYFFRERVDPGELSWESREQCLLKGGCCERDCGCCKEYRDTKSEDATDCWDIAQDTFDCLSHYTSQCRCCAEYRGYLLTSEESEDGFRAE